MLSAIEDLQVVNTISGAHMKMVMGDIVFILIPQHDSIQKLMHIVKEQRYFSLRLYFNRLYVDGSYQNFKSIASRPIFTKLSRHFTTAKELYICTGGKCIIYVFHSLLNNLHVNLINNCLQSLVLQVPQQKNFLCSCNFQKNHHFCQNINSQNSQLQIIDSDSTFIKSLC